MASVIAIRVVTIPIITLTTVCHVKKNRNGVFLRREVDALVWDPTVVRALLDEKIYRNPTVALISPERARKA
jgi:hypothetical protein